MNSRQKTRFIQGLLLTLVIWSFYFMFFSSTAMEQVLDKASNQRGDTAFAMVMVIGMLKYVLVIAGICLPASLVYFWLAGKRKV